MTTQIAMMSQQQAVNEIAKLKSEIQDKFHLMALIAEAKGVEVSWCAPAGHHTISYYSVENLREMVRDGNPPEVMWDVSNEEDVKEGTWLSSSDLC
jgi:hypothetical protein